MFKKTRKRKHRGFTGLRKIIFRGSKNKETLTLLPSMNKENTFTDNVEEGLLVSPEERPKRVSLLNQEEAQIKKRVKSKKKKQNNAHAAPSLLVTNTSLSGGSDQEDSDNEAEDLEKLRKELQNIRNKLATNGLFEFIFPRVC